MRVDSERAQEEPTSLVELTCSSTTSPLKSNQPLLYFKSNQAVAQQAHLSLSHHLHPGAWDERSGALSGDKSVAENVGGRR